MDITIKHGSTVEATRNGFASLSGIYITDIYLDPSWHTGNHKVDFIIRPGQPDEWSAMVLFKAMDPEPLTPSEEEMYHSLSHPLSAGDIITLVHEPTDTVILEFRL